ncbi:MAG: ATP-binding protein [Lachnospiraceae bacterium]|nr:ATP-binding protein [Lachnospiraceae bacterium]
MKNSIFRRKLYDKMLQWKEESSGHSALLIKGARRVGKSTLAENFAQNEYESYILIDFSVAPVEVLDLFRDISDLNYIFMRLQMIYRVRLIERKSVIIFDEVQKAPLARQAIKHLVKDHRYDYIETGSLLSIRMNVKDIVIPSEEQRVQLYPLDYEEFKWALGDEVTIPMLKTVYEEGQSLGDAMNRRLMRDFRLYMLVGGMPQAVMEYIRTNNLEMVDRVKRNIIELYEEDFRKVDSSGRAMLMFDAIPAQLNSNASRYQVGGVIEGERVERIQNIIADMQDSMTVYVSYHANNPSAGLAFHKNLSQFKLFLCDTGLFTTLAFKDKDFTENILYEKLLSDKLSVDLGYLYENIVAQILKASGNELYYHTFPKDNSTHNYEVDFLIAKRNKICPIEVKSSGYKTHKSLDAFCNKFSEQIGNKYLLYTKDVAKEKDILCLPVYMTQFL